MIFHWMDVRLIFITLFGAGGMLWTLMGLVSACRGDVHDACANLVTALVWALFTIPWAIQRTRGI